MLLTSVEGGQDTEAIRQRFHLTRVPTLQILQFLKDAQLCEEIQGKFKMISTRTHLEFGSPFLV